MSPRAWLALPLLLASGGFFLAALAGLLRFPDAFSRIHAVTKADTVALLLLVLGLALTAESWGIVLRLLLVSFLVMAASATTATLIARAAREPD